MLKIPKTKLYIARAMRYVGVAAAVLLCFLMRAMEYKVFVVLVFVFIVLAVVGDMRIRSLYKCPRCNESLLPYKKRYGFEKACPEFCPRCGGEIVVEITDKTDD